MSLIIKILEVISSDTTNPKAVLMARIGGPCRFSDFCEKNTSKKVNCNSEKTIWKNKKHNGDHCIQFDMFYNYLHKNNGFLDSVILKVDHYLTENLPSYSEFKDSNKL